MAFYELSDADKEYQEDGLEEVFVDFTIPLGGTTEDSQIFFGDAIVSGGLTVNRYCCSGDSLSIGNAIAAEAIVIFNRSEWEKQSEYGIDETDFIGSKMQIGVRRSSNSIWKQLGIWNYLGWFVVDSVDVTESTITFTGLDYMTYLDISADGLWASMGLIGQSAYTSVLLSDILRQIRTNIQEATKNEKNPQGYFINYDWNSFVTASVNADIKLYNPGTGYTYRQIISFVAAAQGTNAYFSGDGMLKLATPWAKYDASTEENSPLSKQRTYNFTAEHSEHTITGIRYWCPQGGDLSNISEYSLGTDECEITVGTNPMLRGSTSGSPVMENVFNALNGFTFRKFEATTLPLPNVQIGDVVSIYRAEDKVYQAVVTDWTYKLNGATALMGKGDKTAEETYSPTVEPKKSINAALIYGNITGIDDKVNAGVYIGANGIRINYTDNPGEGQSLYLPTTGATVADIYAYIGSLIVDTLQVDHIINLNTLGLIGSNPTLGIYGNGANLYVNDASGNNTTITPANIQINGRTIFENTFWGFGYSGCTTAAATATKVVAMEGYLARPGGIVSIYFQYAVPANATLNINNQGAKQIRYRYSQITSGVIAGGDTATFIYDGSYYHLISLDKTINKLSYSVVSQF